MDAGEDQPASTAETRFEARFHRPHRLNALADGVFAIAMTLPASSSSVATAPG